MDSSGSVEASEAPDTDGAGAAVERAAQLRVSLSARRDIEAMLAEASQHRATAAADSDELVEEAQQVSRELLAESREHSERIRADAEASADAYRERVRAQAHALIDDADVAIRALGANLESTTTALAESLTALTDLRRESAGPTPGAAAEHAAESATESAAEHAVEPVEADAAPAYASVPPPAVAAQAPAFAVPADLEPTTNTAVDQAELSLAERFPEPMPASLGPGFVVIPESERPPLAVVPESSGPALAEVPGTTSASARGESDLDAPAAESEPAEQDTTPSDEHASKDEPTSRPLGWLFRSNQ